MVFNRVRNFLVQAVVPRVITPHDALQLGELTHHVGHQIGFGKACRHIGLGRQRLAANLLANRPGNRPYPFHAFALGAQLVVVNHFGQARYPRFQRLLAVLVKEKLGISQARAHHALVALNDGTGISRVDVAHHQKLVGQLAFVTD